MNQKTVKISFTIIWMVLVCLVVKELYKMEVYGITREIKDPIARLESSIGNVEYRPREMVSWFDTLENQEFLQGDFLGTTKGSYAKVRFSSGQEIELDENTQVELSVASDASTINIRLLKGYIAAKKVSDKKIKINAGSKSINLSAKNKGFCVKKPLLAEGKDICARNGMSESKPKFAAFTAPPPAAIRVIEDQPRLSIDAEGFAPIFNLAENTTSATIWTQSSLADHNLVFDMKTKPPKERPKAGLWRPGINVQNINEKAPEVDDDKLIVWGQRVYRSQDIQIPVASLLKATQIPPQQLGQGLNISLSATASLLDPKTKDEDIFVESTNFEVALKSIADLPSGPIEVGIKSLRFSKNNPKWIQQLEIPNEESARFKIRVISKNMLAPLWSVLADGQFYIKPVSSLDRKGIYAARDMELIASIQGSINSLLADRLLEVFEADFMFKGNQTPYFDAKNKSVNDLQSWINQRINSKRPVYVMRKGEFFPISRGFLSGQKQVLQFIGRNAKYIFDQKVDILSSRY